MAWSVFLAMFVPGLLIGGSSTLLLLGLWNTPPALLNTKERELVVPVSRVAVSPERVRVGDPALIQRRSERRHVLEHHNRGTCNETHLASPPIQGGPYQLLVLLHSTPRAVEMRDAIRNTWLRDNHKQKRFAARFVVGVANLKPGDLSLVACENMEYGDMVLLPNYEEPIKSHGYSSSEKLLQSLTWAQSNVNFEYIFKGTDSTFAVIDTILNELATRESKTKKEEDYLWGFFAGGIQAAKKGRLAEENWFLCTHYLPYPEGGGYIISKGLVSLLTAVGSDLEHYLHDDIALGVWLSPFSGIERHHDVRFNTGSSSRGCSNQYIVTHKESMQNMHTRHVLWSKSGVLCEHEFSSRPSYHFNWTVPSNRCCVRETGVP